MNFKRSLSIFSGLIVVAILVAACSPAQGTPAANTVSPIDQQPTSQETLQVTSTVSSPSNSADACALLSKEDVTNVIGLPVLTAEASGLGGVCTYKTDKLGIDFTLSQTGGIKAMNTTLTNLGDLALVVPGLGDLAFYNINSANALFVLKGDAEYLFSMSDLTYQPLDPSYVQTTEKALAEKLLSNLP